tara:strand:+ start:42 stop:485 length:444 start_codon:yes stop_codon:yes gene_type:complete
MPKLKRKLLDRKINAFDHANLTRPSYRVVSQATHDVLSKQTIERFIEGNKKKFPLLAESAVKKPFTMACKSYLKKIFLGKAARQQRKLSPKLFSGKVIPRLHVGLRRELIKLGFSESESKSIIRKMFIDHIGILSHHVKEEPRFIKK